VITLRTRLEGAGEPTDLVVDVDDAASGADLTVALQKLGLTAGRVSIDGRTADPNRPLVEHPLVKGSRLELASATASDEPTDGPNLVVISGPEAGAWYPVRVGRTVRVGRADSELLLARDDLLSKQHAEFTYDGNRVTVRDLDSSNGTYVEGERLEDSQEIDEGTYVHIGSSTLAVVTITPADRSILGSPANGAYPFPRTFRSAVEPLTLEHRLPRPPADNSSSGATWWRSLLPLVSGIGFAVVTGRYVFLLIAALAPIVYMVDALRQKRKRAKDHAGEQERFEAESASIEQSFVATALEERRRRRSENPAGGTASLYAIVRHRRLWERRPEDEDFLSVTCGLATMPSQSQITEATGDNPVKRNYDLWGSPVSVDLGATGSLAVLGDRRRARAVVRSLLMGIAVTHAPSEVKFWLFAEDATGSEWGPLRWLPHISEDNGTCRISSTVTDRSIMMSSLKQIIDSRVEERRSSSDAMPLPIHLVVIDGADLLSASDRSAILLQGRSAGVIGIVADPTIAPDGIMGTLQLGAAADEASFVSRLQPLITGVLTAEMPAVWAESGARRLAALQPSSTGRAAVSATSERLAKTVRAAETDPAALAAHWRATGPTTRVPVGTSSDATFWIDVVRDGPHGLVGGMTRSGKTEFLKTLITSLAWANHPDDLNFVIVDFKGGIDYTVASRLPHVLDLSSNQDLAGFERTLQLLTAEQRRRQTLFERLEVSNLDAYRLREAQDRSLPPVPRLIVLIDEFGELLSSDEGRDQLKRIESMSRIGGGLGVHLLLITQNFEGQLPPQIAANAGLRVCFRVQEPANSKVVIDSSIAATIPAGAQGRAYARLQGADPVEFQSARVAGRRPDLRGNEEHVTVRMQPFETLPHQFSTGGAIDVPAEETDMFAMIETINRACAVSGWNRPAVPWPATLPADIALAEVIGGTASDEIRIGRADVPEHQRQVDFSIRWADEHIALLGGPRADLGTLVVTMACSAAVTHSPDDVHIYGIDFAGRGLARIAGLPHCGGVASRNDQLAIRIARHLVDEVSRRRSALATEGVSTLKEYEQRTGRTFPHVLLFIAGAEKLSAIASADDPSGASPALMTLITEGSGLGVQVIAAGLPAFGMYRPGSYVDRRVVFEAADMADYVALGCPRPLIGDLRGPRRGVDTASQLVVQMCSLAGGDANEADALDGLVHRLNELWGQSELARPPVVISEVIWPTPMSALTGALRQVPTRTKHPLLVGIDNVTGDPAWIDAAECGGCFFVAGARKTGRSSALMAIGVYARHLDWDVIGVTASPNSPFHEDGCPFEVVEFAELDARLERAGSPVMVVIDDVQRLEGLDPPIESARIGDADLVVSSGPVDFMKGVQRPLINLGTRQAKSGIVLMPEGIIDAELVGAKGDAVRATGNTRRRAGQGLMGVAGEVFDITVPLFDPG
jgi:S-DNA-T family DNA segregation ATPase FtsK/SpoIIIE